MGRNNEQSTRNAASYRESVTNENTSMVVMIDNYDSFTYNLVQYLAELGSEVRVFRNDQITVDEVIAMAPSHIVLSPGPCTPNEAGICLDLVGRIGWVETQRIPILGVCLGHQAIAQAYGATITRAREIMHGKVSAIHHTGSGVFQGLPTPFNATRYHSLIVQDKTLPECLKVTAWTEHPQNLRDEVMGIRHETLPIEGVQFHPESILTDHGHKILKNFLET